MVNTIYNLSNREEDEVVRTTPSINADSTRAQSIYLCPHELGLLKVARITAPWHEGILFVDLLNWSLVEVESKHQVYELLDYTVNAYIEEAEQKSDLVEI